MTDREYKLRTEIADLNALLEKNEDSAWVMGDPYEALSDLERQLSVEIGKTP